MSFGSRTVAQRDVNFNVNLGQFRAELGEATSAYARSTGAMSTEALKLSVAEERVARAIKLHGATSIQARNATVAYRREVQGLTTSTIISRDALLSEEKALGRFTRGAIAGSGAAKGLGRSLAFSSAAFLGSAGLVYAIRASVKAAEQQEVALEQLKVALRNSGHEWGQYGKTIDEALNLQVKATAFTKEELTTTLAANVRRFGDVNKALRANSLEADVARAKNISLADAFSLVQRASFGQPRSLRILGIELTKTTANMDALKASTSHASAEQVANAKAADLQANETAALDAVQANYHGHAAKYLTTTAGKQALFAAELKLTEEIIGTALLPELNKLLGDLTKYLDKLNRTGKLQKDARQAAHDLTEAIKGFSDALHIVAAVIGPVNKAVGGARHSMELLTLAYIGWKLRGAGAFVLGTKTVEASAVAQAAAVEGAAVKVGLLSRALGVLAGIGTIVVAVDIVENLISPGTKKTGQGVLNTDPTGLAGYVGGHVPIFGPLLQGSAGEGYKTGQSLFGTGNNGGYGTAAANAAARKHPGVWVNAKGQLVDRNGRVLPNTSGMSNDPVHDANRGGAVGGSRSTPKPAPGLTLGLTNAQETALLVAEGTKGTGDDQTALQTQLAIYNRLLAQKGLNAAQRNALLAGRNSVTSQLQGIAAANASAAQSAKSAAAARARKAEQGRYGGVTDRIQRLDARARLERGRGQFNLEKKTLQDEEHLVEQQIHNAELSLAHRRALQKRLDDIRQRIDDVGRQAKAARLKAQQAREDRQDLLFARAEARAALTLGTGDDLKVFHAEEDAVKRRLAVLARIKHLTNAQLQAQTDLLTRQKQLQDQIKGIVGETGQGAAILRQYLGAERGLYGAASNVFTETGGSRSPGSVTVNQHFNAPPTTDGHREAIYAKHAAMAAYDG